MATFLDKLKNMQDVNKGYGDNTRQQNTYNFNRSNDPVNQDTRTEQEKYDDLVGSSRAIDAIGLAAPVGVGAALKGIRDYQIDQMEKKNKDLAPNNPYSAANRNRFSRIGQILGGFGYDPRYPKPDLLTRALNAVTDRDYVPREAFTNVYNRGIPVVDVLGGHQVASGGWETGGGGGDGPAAARGTSNFGGRESMVDNTDRSGYA